MVVEIFNCFKRICIIERNTNECYRSNPNPKEVQATNVKKIVRSNYKVQQSEVEDLEREQEITVHVASELNPKSWNSFSELKFPCPMLGHKHEVSKCKELLI